MLTYWKLHKFPILMVLSSILFYVSFAYDLQRTDFIKLLTLFTALFFLCYKLVQFEKWNFKFLVIAGILFRLVFLFAEPNLSQDFYRFIWDGQLVVQGINPYLYIPDTLIDHKNIVLANSAALYQGMGSLSAGHFSSYPPLNQLLFALAVIVSGKSIMGTVVAMRLTILLADLGILYFGRKLLQQLNRSNYLIFWYFLNPLVIIELTGNLHFEGVMIFLFISSLYLLSKKQWLWAAIVYGLSISLKLIPLLFLPLFIKQLGLKKSLLFYLLVAGTTLLVLLPFYSPDFLNNYSETIGLWFTNFEFNAGLYNLIKQIALHFQAKPWELIKSFGKITPYLTLCVVLLFTFLRNNKKLPILMNSMLWVLFIYYFLASTVHPWYIIFLVVLTIYTDFRFSLVWSFVIILSYTAYSHPDYKELLWVLFVEYFAVYGFMFYEMYKLNGQKLLFHKN